MGLRLALCTGLVGVVCPLHAQPVLPARATEGGRVVLTHRADALTKAPAWTLGPLLGRAGGAATPELDLTYVGNVVLLRDGRLLALAAVGNRFYRFSATGRFEKALARQGAGPGEIMAPMGLAPLRGDTVFIADPSNHRISWFTADRFVRGVPMPSAGGFLNVAALGALRSGTLVLREFGTFPDPRAASPIRITIRAFLSPASGASIRPLAALPDLDLEVVATNYRGKAGRTPDMIRHSPMAHVAAWDTVVVTARSDAYRVDLRDSTGRIQRQLRVVLPRRALTSAMRDADIAAELARFNLPGGERMVDKAESQRLARLAPSADSLPAFDALHVSTDQLLWIVDARAANDTAGSATAFRADGAIVGRLRWSGRGVPLAFGSDRVVMRESDDDGVVSLAIYRLPRR